MDVWQLRQSEEKVISLSKENDQLLKERDAAFQEAYMWRTELGKAREQAVIQEAAIARAEKVRVSEADATARMKEAAANLHAVEKEKEELLALIGVLQSQVQRFLSLSPSFHTQFQHATYNTDIYLST